MVNDQEQVLKECQTDSCRRNSLGVGSIFKCLSSIFSNVRNREKLVVSTSLFSHQALTVYNLAFKGAWCHAWPTLLLTAISNRALQLCSLQAGIRKVPSSRRTHLNHRMGFQEGGPLVTARSNSPVVSCPPLPASCVEFSEVAAFVPSTPAVLLRSLCRRLAA